MNEGIRFRIYRKSPRHLQDLLISAYGLGWKRRRFGGVFDDELRAFKAREAFTEQEWLDYQSIALRRLTRHAYESVPFYREHFKSNKLIRDGANVELDILKTLPFLEKEHFRTWSDSQLVSRSPEKSGTFFSSSGSTGAPTRTLYSRAMHQRWSAAFEARIRHWAGVDRLTPRGMIGGRRVVPDGNARAPFYRYNFFEKQTYFSAYHISPENVDSYLEGILRHRPQYMTGYAMSNYFLARFFEERGLEVPSMKAVITSSEKLTPEMRSVFQRVYQCKTYDSWSGVEACGLVSECEFGSLHVSPDVGIIEILDENDRPVKPGEVGEVVCTGLLNFDQPLIRYRIGDLMRLGKGKCACGREMPVIEEIIGRVEDTVVGQDGREMVRFHGIFIDLPNIVEGQIVQHDYDEFEVKVVTVGRLAEHDVSLIRSRMLSQLGQVRVTVISVATIPRNSNGKFKAVVSHVNRRQQ